MQREPGCQREVVCHRNAPQRSLLLDTDSVEAVGV